MPLFPAVFVLRHIRVHIYPSDGGNVVSYIETSVNKTLCLAPIVNIPNVQPNNGYIQFWEYLDNMWFRYQGNVIKNLILFDDIFNILQCYMRQ